MWHKGLMALGLFLTIVSAAHAELCKNWGAPKLLGGLDAEIINEASGLTFSKLIPQRLFHVNDSGDGPYFFTTNRTGQNTQRVEVRGFSPLDVEGLAYGPCGQDQCLVIGDIGDNARVRPFLQFIFVKDREKFPKSVRAKKIFEVAYPDGPHNAEGFAMNSHGDIFILTKEAKKLSRAALPSKLYRLPREKMEAHKKGRLVLEHVGTIDFPKILPQYDVFGKIITGFDIDEANSRALVLTYRTALEIHWGKIGPTASFDVERWVKGQDYQEISHRDLDQEEAITYGPGGLYYTSEANEGRAPIYFHACR